MKYVVLDLEMCKVPKSLRNETYRWCYETIQIGAVLLDENYDVMRCCSSGFAPLLILRPDRSSFIQRSL